MVVDVSERVLAVFISIINRDSIGVQIQYELVVSNCLITVIIENDKWLIMVNDG